MESMKKTRALIIGVSEYLDPHTPDLAFCRNDVYEIKDALHVGLKLDNEDIVLLGESNTVTAEEFVNTLKKLADGLSQEDNFIFYFSGHGCNIKGQHYLAFSDDIVSTQVIIGFLEKIAAKGKVVFLDCCYSGNYSVDGVPTLSLEKTIDEFVGKGCAVLSSSNSTQVSFGHPDRPISIFTSFLCDAFRDKHIVRKGVVSLYDIQKLVCLYSSVWSLRKPELEQQPIFRSNLGGTIFFTVDDYVPYKPMTFYEETSEYIIHEIQPMHKATTKRYSVGVILKEPFSLDEIAGIALDVTEKVRSIEVHSSSRSEWNLTGKSANIVWIYFGRDVSDMISRTYLCMTTWVDDAQNKEWWYRVDNKNTYMISTVHFKIFPYYENLRQFYKENTGTQESVIAETKDMLASLVTLAESIIIQYNEYKNLIISEQDLFNGLESLIIKVDALYMQSTDFAIPPDNVKDWSEACSMLFGTIHDMTLYYNKKYINQRNPKNRRACMDMAVTRYYTDLERVRKLEIGI